MKQLTSSEVIFLSKILQLEATNLSVSNTSLSLISDNKLKSVVKAGIESAENRIKGLQQFLSDNDLVSIGGGH
ncbi:UNVERIFIED_CONTAM: hypothetical protein Cloal_2361 [Acetivibrio alkalicellulosi]